jgi:hypothetical protein
MLSEQISSTRQCQSRIEQYLTFHTFLKDWENSGKIDRNGNAAATIPRTDYEMDSPSITKRYVQTAMSGIQILLLSHI